MRLLIIVCTVLVILGAAYLLFIPGMYSSPPRHMAESTTFRTLKDYSQAQIAYRTKGSSGGFRRDDIAGLYGSKDQEGHMFGLVELSTATADARPVTKLDPTYISSAKAGYLYRAIRYRDESVPDLNRFAACAYPANPNSQGVGTWMYVVTEKGIYRKTFANTSPPEFFPTEPEKEGWERRAWSEKY